MGISNKDQSAIAEKIAREAHKGQLRRDGVNPYIIHPQRVAQSLEGNPKAQAVAWLHDVLEDTDMTTDDLKDAGISAEIIEAVVKLTKSDGIDYFDYLDEIKKNELAKVVKIADINDNLNDAPSDKQKKKYEEGLDRLSSS